MGSYFGSSLCAVDLNQDGLSDLLVGAPMYSEVRDEGQVSVYLSRGNVSPFYTRFSHFYFKTDVSIALVIYCLLFVKLLIH